jgi:hypothetical protein
MFPPLLLVFVLFEAFERPFNDLCKANGPAFPTCGCISQCTNFLVTCRPDFRIERIGTTSFGAMPCFFLDRPQVFSGRSFGCKAGFFADLLNFAVNRFGVWGATEQKTGLRNDRYSSSGASGLRRGRN